MMDKSRWPNNLTKEDLQLSKEIYAKLQDDMAKRVESMDDEQFLKFAKMIAEVCAI